jgi:hypothetical protein
MCSAARCKNTVQPLRLDVLISADQLTRYSRLLVIAFWPPLLYYTVALTEFATVPLSGAKGICLKIYILDM